MIIAEQKPLKEIIKNLEGHRKILVAGCRSCVAICLAGGEKEVGIIAESLRLYSDMHDHLWEVDEITVERQCEKEWVKEIKKIVEGKDAILSMACGVGAQVMQEIYPDIRVVPGLNTSNMGAPEEQGIWREKCAGCGDCVLHLTGGICPIARCSKSLLNGPCGGSQNGRCEVNPETTPCAWDQIYHSLKRLGKLELMEQIIPPKNWITSHSGGPRRIVKQEAILTAEEKAAKGGLE
ncbi:MAG: methylenetetrahydrofolate reductase C-terminal domain-containing protein [Methanomassiliicoccales archaeon]|jgi:ferredoxin|nr:methylenetetrahydrofolate reductase C-terminal domain-containing protein [Methanomassiliicoccales archaeon]